MARMDKEQIIEFIKLIKSLDIQQKMGVLAVTEGMKLLSEKKKR